GDTVLDLGSGGKLCYVAAQIVGPEGFVIGVDANDEMLALAEKYRREVGDRIGYHNVEFRKGRIQDLRLDLRAVDSYLRERPIGSAGELAGFESHCARIREERPLVPDESVDVVLSNCVLNLVRPEDKERLFAEMFRVVRRGGRVAVSDIVADEDVLDELMQDPELWSGCVAGAYREDAFLDAFDRAGFYGMEVVKRGERPWRTVRGIEFRSITVVAHKGKQGPCWERKQAVPLGAGHHGERLPMRDPPRATRARRRARGTMSAICPERSVARPASVVESLRAPPLVGEKAREKRAS
ncbi:MAG: methyltransferase domain-containing protein, partial [Acidobacteria bacterium]|nr:methyltransferase domain-containing protein [Acidobacteriota bacterium]